MLNLHFSPLVYRLAVKNVEAMKSWEKIPWIDGNRTIKLAV